MLIYPVIRRVYIYIFSVNMFVCHNIFVKDFPGTIATKIFEILTNIGYDYTVFVLCKRESVVSSYHSVVLLFHLSIQLILSKVSQGF